MAGDLGRGGGAGAAQLRGGSVSADCGRAERAGGPGGGSGDEAVRGRGGPQRDEPAGAHLHRGGGRVLSYRNSGRVRKEFRDVGGGSAAPAGAGVSAAAGVLEVRRGAAGAGADRPGQPDRAHPEHRAEPAGV